MERRERVRNGAKGRAGVREAAHGGEGEGVAKYFLFYGCLAGRRQKRGQAPRKR